MDLQLVPGPLADSGATGSAGGSDGRPDTDRLTEAEGLIRRTRQRLEEIADRLSELRRGLEHPPSD